VVNKVKQNQSEKIEKVYSQGEGLLVDKGQKIKLMTYNVQFFSGRNYVFFFDLPDFSGPDFNVKSEDIKKTTKAIANRIIDESPDVLLLQEVDDGSRRTGKKDQLYELLSLLDGQYPYYTSSFYWKATFIPHPKIMGSLGMKLSIISKYVIADAKRYDLPSLPANFFMRPFLANRVILKASLKRKDGGEFVVLNTHLDAFVMGSDIMEQQVDKVDQILSSLDKNDIPWIIGGDFNLLPEGQYEKLPEDQKNYYNSDTEIKNLYQTYNIIPSSEHLRDNLPSWYTFWGNDPNLKGPDRTLDYLLYSKKLILENASVLQNGTSELSDHFPVVAEFTLS